MRYHLIDVDTSCNRQMALGLKLWPHTTATKHSTYVIGLSTTCLNLKEMYRILLQYNPQSTLSVTDDKASGNR